MDAAWLTLAVQGVTAVGVLGGGGVFFIRVARQDERRASDLRNANAELHRQLGEVVAGLGAVETHQIEANKLFRDHERICDEFRGGVTSDLKRVVENSGKVDDVVLEMALANKDIDTIKGNIDWGTSQFENIARQLGEVGRRLGIIYPAPDNEETRRRPPVRGGRRGGG